MAIPLNKFPFYAASYGKLSVVKYLLGEVRDKNPKDKYGYTPLHYAAETGKLSVVRYIMSCKGVKDKNPKDCCGDTPLHNAAEFGHYAVCKLIVENIENKNPR